MLTALLYLIGLTLSVVAAYYSVTGLGFVFAGAFWPVVIMGSTLEAAKLVAASWLFRSWRRAPRILVTYLTTGVLLLMLLTGIGIFGYLSRAYLIQQAPVAQTMSDVSAAQRTVDLAQAQYDRDAAALKDLSSGQTTDKVIGKLTDTNRLTGSSGAVSVLKTQQSLQQTARKQLSTSSAELATAQKALATAQASASMQTADLGPLMFAAKAWYGTADVATMDKVVRWFIVLIMLVFDPMAIALLLAAQQRVSPSASSTPTTAKKSSPTSSDNASVPPVTIPTMWKLTDHPEVTPSVTPEIDASTDTELLATPSLSNSTLPVESPRVRKPGMKAATVKNLRS